MTQTMPSGANLQLKGLVKRYGATAAADNVNLTVEAGEFLTLLGPSGSGKTTTLSMIAGFTAPTEGRVIADGTEITAIPPHKRGLGMVFQNYSLFPHMTVQQNVEFPLRQRGIAKDARAKLAMEALELVELGDRAKSRPSQLSGGQQQRVALARALVFKPRLLLMDEPFGALDKSLRERLQIELRYLHQNLGVTVIFVTHDQEEALTMSDRIAVFNEGKVEQVGTPKDLYERPETLFVARFIGESNAISGTVSDQVFDSGHNIKAPTQLDDGPATAIVRPQHITVNSSNTATQPELVKLPGIVKDVTYLGSQQRVEISTTEGVLVVRTGVDTAPDTGIDDGQLYKSDEVVLSWPIDKTTFFSNSNKPTELRSPWTTTLVPPTSI